MTINANRKLTAIRRSLHKAFIRKNHLKEAVEAKTFTTCVSSMIQTILRGELSKSRQDIMRLRIEEGLALSREFTRGGTFGESAYPMRGEKKLTISE